MAVPPFTPGRAGHKKSGDRYRRGRLQGTPNEAAADSFTWSAASGATSYWLDVGTVVGGFNLYTQGEALLTSQTVSGLPTGGSTIYVRLWSAIGGIWQHNDYTYKAAP